MLYKAYFIFIIFIIISLIIPIQLINIIYNNKLANLLFKILKYQQLKKNNEIIHNNTTRYNIYDFKNKLIAFSAYKYNVYIDLKIIPKDLFYYNVDLLCNILARYNKKSHQEIKKKILQAYIKQNRYYLIISNINYITFKEFIKNKLFDNKIFKNSIINNKYETRINMISDSGKKTIGYIKNNIKTGLEESFDQVLKPLDSLAKRKNDMINQIPNKIFYINTTFSTRKLGGHVYTNIDLSLQNAAHKILLKKLISLKAYQGTSVIMDVNTGAIKAIVNLTKIKNNTYQDVENIALKKILEPGSMFKVICMLIALEDKKIDINTKIKTGKGFYKIGKSIIYDTSACGEITAQKAIEISSNVAMAKIIHDNYKDNIGQFFKYLYKWKINKITNIEINGEAIPFVPNINSKTWCKKSLAWIAFGYYLKMTPLQMLTFYNGIANNGKLMQPYLINKIKNKNKILIKKHPIVINHQMASKESIKKIQKMLEGVVKYGTAKNIYNIKYPYAGKTATTQIDYWQKKNQKKKYHSAFVGYYPANDPQYSCIVIISDVKNGNYYGNEAAAPVFDEIMKYIYSYSGRIEKTSKEIINTYYKNAINKKRKYEKILITNNIDKILPFIIGKPGKYIIPLLEHNKLKVKYSGVGIIKSYMKHNNNIVLKLE